MSAAPTSRSVFFLRVKTLWRPAGLLLPPCAILRKGFANLWRHLTLFLPPVAESTERRTGLYPFGTTWDWPGPRSMGSSRSSSSCGHPHHHHLPAPPHKNGRFCDQEEDFRRRGVKGKKGSRKWLFKESVRVSYLKKSRISLENTALCRKFPNRTEKLKNFGWWRLKLLFCSAELSSNSYPENNRR